MRFLVFFFFLGCTDYSQPFKEYSLVNYCVPGSKKQVLFNHLQAQARITCLENDFSEVRHVEHTFLISRHIRSWSFCHGGEHEGYAQSQGIFYCIGQDK